MKAIHQPLHTLLLLISTTLFLASAPPASAPSTQPAPAILQLDTLKALIELSQDARRIRPDPQGVYHLRPAPFDLHILGNADNLGIVAAPTFDFAKKIARQKQPIIILGGTGAAYDDHELFIQKDAALIPFDNFDKPELLADIMPEIKSLMKNEISGPLLTLSVPFQMLHAPDNASDFTLSLTTPYLFEGTLLDPPKPHAPPAPIPWAKAPRSLSLVVLLTKPYNQYLFSKTQTLPLQLQFDPTPDSTTPPPQTRP